MSRTVAIVGAGIAGLACAQRLRASDVPVVLFDKGNRAGGRASTRLHAGPFDHGAQFFTARDPDFRHAVAGWCEEGWVGAWEARVARLRPGAHEPAPTSSPRYVGTPDMGSLPIRLAEGLDLHASVRITGVEGEAGHRMLRDTDGERRGPYDTVVVAVPPVQAEALLADAPELARASREARMAPCWAAMMRFDGPLALPFDAAEVDDPVLSWIARDGSKPGRPDPDRWVVHAGIEWSRREEEIERPRAEEQLAAAFARVTGVSRAPIELRAHRWRYARVERAVGSPCGWEDGARIGACGDWWIEGRLEAAWRSGHELAGRILGEAP